MNKKKEVSGSTPGLSMMTPRECRVDHPFPSHMTTCWVRNRPHPPPPPAQNLTLRYRKRCRIKLWLARLVLIHPHLHRLHPYLLEQKPLEARVSVFLYLCCFPWRAAFALLCSSVKSCFSSPFQKISCDAILAIMELDWICTGVLKVRHPCLLRAFHELFSLLEKQKGSR